jgi:hypothetical protein
MSECGEEDRSRFSHNGGCDADDGVVPLEEQEDSKDPEGICEDATAEVTTKGTTRVRASIVEADTKFDTRRGGVPVASGCFIPCRGVVHYLQHTSELSV